MFFVQHKQNMYVNTIENN